MSFEGASDIKPSEGSTEVQEKQGDAGQLPNEIGGKNDAEKLPGEIGGENDAGQLPNEIGGENDVQENTELKTENMEAKSTKGLEGTNETDDNGNIYVKDGQLQPNITYELNGSIYTTDDKGRIVCCESKPQRSQENSRDNDAQRQAGGTDRRPDDQGGHIVARDLNGDGGSGNLVAMDSRINQSDYKRMENDIKTTLDEGKEVTVKTEITYSDNSERPDRITTTVTVDGKTTIYKYDNNLEDSLMNDIPVSGKKDVQSGLNDTGGKISSIKEEYDEKGNLVKTSVCITYTDADGNNKRIKVIVDNVKGGINE